MTWNAAYTIRDAVEAKFTGSAFGTILSAVNSAQGTSAPQIAADGRLDSGVAVYTVPTTTYQFPCVEITPLEGAMVSHSVSSTTSYVSVWVFVSFRGTEEELDEWSLVYLTALVRTFLPDVGAGNYEWSPAEFTASPVGSTAEGTYVQAVGVRLQAEIAEAI